MFVAYNKVRMHDTDMAGILYFARQFRFAHDALEDLLEAEGYNFDNMFKENAFFFVIVHAEADYLQSVKVGMALEVHVSIEKIGASSITFLYHIYSKSKNLLGVVKTVHVCIDSKSREKTHVPEHVRVQLEKYVLSKNDL